MVILSRLIFALCLVPMLVYAQEVSKPLSESELREILVRLQELKVTRAEAEIYHRALDAMEINTKKVDELASRALEDEKRMTSAVERERDLEKRRAEFYEKAFQEATRRRGTGCMIAKIFTIGLARCR